LLGAADAAAPSCDSGIAFLRAYDRLTAAWAALQSADGEQVLHLLLTYTGLLSPRSWK